MDNARVELFYERLTGEKMKHGSWKIDRKRLAERIVHIEEACRSTLDSIDALAAAPFGSDTSELERVVKMEFRFLETLKP
jgi:hypothetical protein